MDSPRIIRIRYRSGVNGRVATAFCKVPYGQLYDLTEKLARLFSQQQIKWYRIDPATPVEIERERDKLVRWPVALAETCSITKINLEV